VKSKVLSLLKSPVFTRSYDTEDTVADQGEKYGKGCSDGHAKEAVHDADPKVLPIRQCSGIQVEALLWGWEMQLLMGCSTI